MRRLMPYALAAAVLACEGALLTIPVEDSAQTTIRQGTVLESVLGDLGLDGFTALDVTASQELQNQGVEPGDIVDVRLVRFDLAVVAPEDGTFDFLGGLDVLVEAPGLPEVRIARMDQKSPGDQTLSLAVEDVDLTPYVTSRSMTITTDAQGGRPTEDTTVEATFELSVGVTTQGACKAIQGETPG
ncbi:MAG: hypothetical protein H6732_03255 [Alphaproteobacteria bacterium]|nr:hypothetical protein [Alphaproteobacteria bacterium]